MDINKVAIFCLVAETGSFTKAAKKLGKPSNTISRNIQELENELSVRLFHRTTRKLTLTPAGVDFFEGTVTALKAIEEASQSIQLTKDQVKGVVRVAVPANFFERFNLDWIAEFLTEHKEVSLQFILTDHQVDLVENSIDLAFRAGDIGNSNLVVREVFQDFGILVAHPEYLSKHGSIDTLNELSTHRCLFGLTMSNSSSWTFDGPNGNEEIEISGNFSADNIKVLIDAAVKGFGIGLFPAIMVAEQMIAGRLVRVLPQYKALGYKGSLVYLNRLNRPKAAIEFTNFLVKKFTIQKTGFKELLKNM